MKRVAIFTQGGVSYPKSVGYVPVLENLFKRLSETNDVAVYTTSPHPGTAGTFTCGSATVRQIDACYNDSTVKKLTAYLTTFRRDHAKKPFDLLHGFWALPGGLLAVTLGRLTRLPSVVSIWGGEAAALHNIGYGGMLRPMSRMATLWTCNRATALTTLTQLQYKGLKAHGLQREDPKIFPCGVDTSLFGSIGSKPMPPPFNLLHVANLTQVKDQETLLKSFLIISGKIEARLRIVGPDHMNGRLQKLVLELALSDKVEFLGLIENSKLPEHYSWAHVMLHTSFYEGQSIVVSEAAASGTVTCGTRVGLIADLEDRCTVAVDVRDHEGLAKKVIDLLHQPEHLSRLQENARAWAFEHDINWTARQFDQLYDELSAVR